MRELQNGNEKLETRNSRPVDPDLLALFFDAKYVEIKDGDQLRPACIYLVAGLRRDGKKQVLSCTIKFGRENLEDRKTVLRGLIERGLEGDHEAAITLRSDPAELRTSFAERMNQPREILKYLIEVEGLEKDETFSCDLAGL